MRIRSIPCCPALVLTTLMLSSTVASAVPSATDARDLEARRILGSWEGRDIGGATVQLDFTFHGGRVDGMDVEGGTWAQNRFGASAASVNSAAVLRGYLSDSRTMERHLFAMIPSGTSQWAIEVAEFNAVSATAAQSWSAHLALAADRAGDRLSVEFAAGESATVLHRPAVYVQEWSRTLERGFRIVNRIDTGARYHAAVEARLESADERPRVLARWEGLCALLGAVSPDGSRAVILLWPELGIGGPGLAYVANLESDSPSTNGPLFVSRSAWSLVSSHIPEPAIVWADEETIVYTDRHLQWQSHFVDPHLILRGHVPGAGEDFAFVDAVTGVTALISPGSGFEFAPTAGGELFFLTNRRLLYPLDIAARTVGSPRDLPEVPDRINPRLSLRELMEKAGAILR